MNWYIPFPSGSLHCRWCSDFLRLFQKTKPEALGMKLLKHDNNKIRTVRVMVNRYLFDLQHMKNGISYPLAS